MSFADPEVSDVEELIDAVSLKLVEISERLDLTSVSADVPGVRVGRSADGTVAGEVSEGVAPTTTDSSAASTVVYHITSAISFTASQFIINRAASVSVTQLTNRH